MVQAAQGLVQPSQTLSRQRAQHVHTQRFQLRERFSRHCWAGLVQGQKVRYTGDEVKCWDG